MTPKVPREQPDRWDRYTARRAELDAQTDWDSPRSMGPRDTADPAPLTVLEESPYVELHLHSHYSLLEGASSIEELVSTAREQGHRALALTDHNGMYGSMEFARVAREAGLRPITGLELTLTGPGSGGGDDRSHITLLAESREGYRNLCRLSSIAFGLPEDTAVAPKHDGSTPVSRSRRCASTVLA